MSKGLRYKEKEQLPSRYERSSHKHAFSEHEHRAFRVVAQPFMLTLTGRKRFTTTEWLDLVAEALKAGCKTGLELKIDGFRQPRDRSIHLAIWGLPRHREMEVTAAIEAASKQACAFRKKRFLVVGLSLAYLFTHEEIASTFVAT